MHPRIKDALSVMQVEASNIDEGLEQKAIQYALQMVNKAVNVINEYSLGDSASVKYEIFTVSRDPRELLVEFCNSVEADLLVTGSRRISLLRKVWCGSVSQYLTKYSSCPVVVVRKPFSVLPATLQQ